MIEAFIRKLEGLALAGAGLCVVAIMLVVSADALSRYGLKAPLPVTYELVTFYLLPAAVYLALSATYRQGDHIQIDLVARRLPPRVRAVADALASLLVLAVFCAIVHGTSGHMAEAWRGKEFIPGWIVWPVWLSYLPIPLGCALLVLRLAHHASALLRHGQDAAVMTKGHEGTGE